MAYRQCGSGWQDCRLVVVGSDFDAVQRGNVVRFLYTYTGIAPTGWPTALMPASVRNDPQTGGSFVSRPRRDAGVLGRR